MPKGSDNPFPSVLLVEGTTPASPAAGRQRLFIDSADSVAKLVDSSGNVSELGSGGGGSPSGGGVVPVSVVNGRLTTESGVPVSSTDRASQSTIYFTPYNGNQIALYDGSDWQLVTFAQLSLALSGLTSGKNYDVFIDYNGGTPQIVLGTAWTNDTTRAVALTTQDGVYVLTANLDHRYVGTIRTTSTTTTEDSGGISGTTNVGGKRFVWNLYNQVPRPMQVIDTTSNWSYTTDTWRQARANAGNQIECVVGLAVSMVDVELSARVLCASNSARAAKAGIGLDSTSAVATTLIRSYFYNTNASQLNTVIVAQYKLPLALGYHYFAWLEKGGDGTSTFGGNDNDAQSGMTGTIWN